MYMEICLYTRFIQDLIIIREREIKNSQLGRLQQIQQQQQPWLQQQHHLFYINKLELQFTKHFTRKNRQYSQLMHSEFQNQYVENCPLGLGYKHGSRKLV